MHIQTFSIVTGGTACNARCPFCVSRMTGDMDVTNVKSPLINWRNFGKACQLAARAGATTAMLTGKGEPLLWAGLITEYLQNIDQNIDYSYGSIFPIIELQTNGLILASDKEDKRLKEWYDFGLTTIGISVVHWLPEKNKEIYTPGKNYIDLPALIKKLHNFGYTVRLCCVMAKDYVDDFDDVKSMLRFCKQNRVEQLTFTPVSLPAMSEDLSASQWIEKHYLDPSIQIDSIIYGLMMDGAMEIMQLPHGARVFDYMGQNVCFNNCLNPGPEDLGHIRNLIFFPDGTVRYKWEAEGSIIF